MHDLRLYRGERSDAQFAARASLAYRKDMTIEAIEEAEAWDRQISADFSQGGAGESLVAQWDAEIARGESMPLDEFLRTQIPQRNS
jgi:hypothetical protein